MLAHRRRRQATSEARSGSAATDGSRRRRRGRPSSASHASRRKRSADAMSSRLAAMKPSITSFCTATNGRSVMRMATTSELPPRRRMLRSTSGRRGGDRTTGTFRRPARATAPTVRTHSANRTAGGRSGTGSRRRSGTHPSWRCPVTARPWAGARPSGPATPVVRRDRFESMQRVPVDGLAAVSDSKLQRNRGSVPLGSTHVERTATRDVRARCGPRPARRHPPARQPTGRHPGPSRGPGVPGSGGIGPGEVEGCSNRSRRARNARVAARRPRPADRHPPHPGLLVVLPPGEPGRAGPSLRHRRGAGGAGPPVRPAAARSGRGWDRRSRVSGRDGRPTRCPPGVHRPSDRGGAALGLLQATSDRRAADHPTRSEVHRGRPPSSRPPCERGHRPPVADRRAPPRKAHADRRGQCGALRPR